MEIQIKEFQSEGIRFFINNEDKKEIAHGYIFIIKNDFHDEPYALFEYFTVDEAYRGQGIGSKLLKTMIEKAREIGCYKILMQSRYGRDDMHHFYEKLGFHDHGKNFRLNLKASKAKAGAHGAGCPGCQAQAGE